MPLDYIGDKIVVLQINAYQDYLAALPKKIAIILVVINA